MDPKMEGVDKRLRDHAGHVEVKDSAAARDASAIIDIPTEIDALVTPPRSLIRLLASREGAMCGQAFELVWETGPWQGWPVTGYCAEPLCITEKVCTGTRFVPHVDQWTTSDPSFRQRRKMTGKEILAAVRMFGHKAYAETGRDEDRTDKEILAHVKLVWRKTLEHIKDTGGTWRRS